MFCGISVTDAIHISKHIYTYIYIFRGNSVTFPMKDLGFDGVDAVEVVWNVHGSFNSSLPFAVEKRGRSVVAEGLTEA